MATTIARPLRLGDYSLVGKDSQAAIQKGLAEATWYASPVPKEKMRELLQRRDAPAIRDALLWFALLIGFGLWAYFLWPSPWCILPFAVYGVLYGSTSDARWHEAGHGTAFKTDWMNNALYEVASFMVMRESTVWRWSHTRHHSDTIIVGRDPEIAAPRPPDMKVIAMTFFNIKVFPKYFRTVILHCFGRMTPEEKTFIPEFEYARIFRNARIYALIYIGVIGLAIYTRSILPLLFVGLPNLYGAWLAPTYGFTQHAGLAENVLDHRLNCRTVYMNRINRFLYLNMNYHVEHHMFPLVPYHNLPQLHALVKSDMPTPYNGLVEAYREIIPALLRQVKDPGFHVKRKLPTPTLRNDAPGMAVAFTAAGQPVVEGWVEVCASGQVLKADVVRFDYNQRTYAIYRAADGQVYASDGLCSHGNTHLAEGMVKGTVVECAKHNGRFDIRDGKPVRLPVCVALKTYEVRETDGKLYFNLNSVASAVVAAQPITHAFRVVSNNNVATFIKELVLEPTDAASLNYQPGDYLQIDIPAYAETDLTRVAVDPQFQEVWRAMHIHEFTAANPIPCRRNYSFATNPAVDRQLRFNVRIATPPRGQACNAGSGSSYIFNLKPGDTVTGIGPFGEFHLKDTERELVYLGGGAGMAPLRAHISHLLETEKTTRPISYWYGARSRSEMFYQDYFEELARQHPNFTFHVALSEPQPNDNWTGPVGYIHEVFQENYLNAHPDPTAIDYFLCGPPLMVQAARDMLKEYEVPPTQVAFDEF